MSFRATIAGLVLAALAACASYRTMDDAGLRDFATRYTAAWNSQAPALVASFFADHLVAARTAQA